MRTFLSKRWVYHSLIWISISLILSSLSWIERREGEIFWDLYLEILYVLPGWAILIYINFALKTILFDQRRYILYVISICILLFGGAYLIHLLDDWVNTLSNTYHQNLINVLAAIPISLGLQYFKRGLVHQYQLQELRVRTSETELNALKAQINPHFLFNTLNNIYGINQINSKRGSEMIMELADVMRYHLELSKKNKVSIADEIQLLRSYIELEKLRLHENCDLRVHLSVDHPSLQISPLLLLPLLENAFKHGTHPSRPCFVHIKLNTYDRTISFEVVNSIIKHKRVVKTHVGLENTKRRLAIIYNEKHSLTFNTTNDTYTVKLIIEV